MSFTRRGRLQGPVADSCTDFWRMVVQENVRLGILPILVSIQVGYIIMLCEIMETGKKKCEK